MFLINILESFDQLFIRIFPYKFRILFRFIKVFIRNLGLIDYSLVIL